MNPKLHVGDKVVLHSLGGDALEGATGVVGGYYGPVGIGQGVIVNLDIPVYWDTYE